VYRKPGTHITSPIWCTEPQMYWEITVNSYQLCKLMSEVNTVRGTLLNCSFGSSTVVVDSPTGGQPRSSVTRCIISFLSASSLAPRHRHSRRSADLNVGLSVTNVYTQQPSTCNNQSLKCHRTQGNAIPPPPIFGWRRTPTSNFVKTQGTVRGMLKIKEGAIHLYSAL